MWRFGLRRVGHFTLGLLVAVILAASVSSLAPREDGSTFSQSLVARIGGIAHLDFGTSAITAAPAWAEVSRRLPITFEIIGLGALIALIAGTIAGVILSDRRAKRLGLPLLQVVSAIPVFCVAIGMLWLSQRLLHWAGTGRPQSLLAALESGNVQVVEAALRAVALPALTVGFAGAYAVQNQLRRAIARTAREPYRRGLRALGLGRFEVDWLYFLPQALATFFSGLGDIAASLFAATAIAEWVFDWPGAVDLLLKSVALRDWTVVGLILFVFAALTMAIEFAGAIVARLFAESGAAP